MTCDVVFSNALLQTFRKYLQDISHEDKGIIFPQNIDNIYQITRCHIPETALLNDIRNHHSDC